MKEVSKNAIKWEERNNLETGYQANILTGMEKEK